MRASGASVRQGGYVLIFVVASLALVAFVAARFALRLDALREQALAMQNLAQARLLVESGKARALFWLSTRPIGLASSGFADEQPLVLDNRSYEMRNGAWIRVQDARGLLSLNVPQRQRWLSALIGAGASLDQASAMIDVLLDYTDTDSLKRLNGAETRDYASAGLAMPRNDWILSVDETALMPVWAANAPLRQQILPWTSLTRNDLFNPNTAPLELLRTLWPKVSPDQWILFDRLRKTSPFVDATAAIAATGIAFSLDDSVLFHASNEVRMQLWAPGLPMAVEYTLSILPTGAYAPWLIQEIRRSDRFAAPDAHQAAKFPDASKDLARPAPSAPPSL
ncbi:MAG: general secretion pathway protein GspK [Roseateles sp.]|uniref:general secretion pathway protein GspK n=1 Tax=Roseateles sp. TaxID=1971397 RepID=UPI004036B912